jgi:hypothetical protein
MRTGAYIMLTIGALVTLLCGSCTLLFLVPTIFAAVSSGQSAAAQEMLVFAIVPLVIGGVPTAAGIFLLVMGWRTLRRANAAARTSAADHFN